VTLNLSLSPTENGPAYNFTALTENRNICLSTQDENPLSIQSQDDLREECNDQGRSDIISQYVELHPEALAMADQDGYLPLHTILQNEESNLDIVLMMIEKYPAALQHRNRKGELPLHIECGHQCRSSIISKLIELYPEALAKIDEYGLLPLHRLLAAKSSVEDALMMIERYPAACQHASSHGHLPLHMECMFKYRLSIISKLVQLYPQAVDDKAITCIFNKMDMKGNLRNLISVLSIIFAARPMSLYDCGISIRHNDIRADPHYRRRILNLLPRHVFTPTHESDYRDLNWQPRAAMMMLLSQMQIQHSSKAISSTK
jgi:hypothetical protein